MNTDAPQMAEPQTPDRSRGRKVVLAILLLVLVAIGFTFLPVGAWLSAARGYIAALGWFAPFAYLLAYMAFTILLIPASALTIGAGSLFGLGGGFLLTVLASNIGANLSFFLARTILRTRVEAWANGNPKVNAVTEAVSKGGMKVVMLLRLSPIFPFTLLNYMLGVTRLSWAQYAIGSLLGMLPGTAAFVYLGFLTASIAGAQSSDPGRNIRLALQAAGFVATVAVTVIVTRLARQSLNEKGSKIP